MVSKCFLKRFPKQRCFQTDFLKNRDYVISYVACIVFLAYDRLRSLCKPLETCTVRALKRCAKHTEQMYAFEAGCTVSGQSTCSWVLHMCA